MTNYLDIKEIKQEVANWLRNSDIFTISQRGITTAAGTGTFSGASSYVINVTNVKNIRSVVVGGTTLTYGEDYQVDFDFLDTTIKCKITFTAAQTGAYTITYDYGTDKIFPDYPRPDLTISSFPRIGFDIIDITSNYAGFGNVLISTIRLNIVTYDTNNENVTDYLTTIRKKIIESNTSFYYLGYIVRPDLIGPLIVSPREIGEDKVMQQNIDMIGEFKYEIN